MKKGFTLVELLAVITLLGIIGVLTIPVINNQIKENREEALQSQVKLIESSAKKWAIANSKYLPVDHKEMITLNLEHLKQSGFVPLDLRNPKTGELFPNDLIITITREYNNYVYFVDVNSGSNLDDKIDTNAPFLALNGKPLEYVEVKTIYSDLGIIALDANSKPIPDITKMIKSNNTEVSMIDTNKFGTYTVTYSASQNINGVSKSSSIIRTVIVRDTTPPVLKVGENITISKNQVATFDLLKDVVVSDNYDTKLTVNTSGMSSIPGKYVVKYSVTDTSGNNTSVNRLITVTP